jgi:hypothetical protein
MRDVLRAELAGLPTIHIDTSRLRLGREPLFWAVLCGIGAGFVVGGITTLAVSAASPILFPPTEPHPSWLSLASISRTASAIAVGAVTVRVAGPTALLVYIGYDALGLIVQLPLRQFSCSRNPAGPGSCDLIATIVDQWPLWISLAIGAIVSRWVPASAEQHPNVLLRGAGAFGAIVGLGTALYGVITYGTLERRSISSGADPFPAVMDVVATGTFVVAEGIAGLVAGIILARTRPAAALLVALLAVNSLPFLLRLANQPGMPPQPLWLAFVTWSGVIARAAGALGLAIGRVLARRSDRAS